MMARNHVCSQCGATMAVADSSAIVPTLCASCQQIGPGGERAEVGGQALPKESRPAGWSVWLIGLIAVFGLVLLCVLIPLVISWFMPLSATMLETQQRHQCAGNLQQISDALDAYKLKYGALPPPYLADSAGQPAHSWRVLLLPFYGIEEYENLYKEYSFEEPWDGPNNSKLHGRMPDVYGCPSDPDAFDEFTSYLALVTAGSTVLGTPPVGLRSPNLDPTAQILVVEVTNSGITWTQPRDLDVSQLTAGVNDPSGQGIGSFHLDGAHVLEDDGDVTFLDNGDTGPGVSRQNISPSSVDPPADTETEGQAPPTETDEAAVSADEIGDP